MKSALSEDPSWCRGDGRLDALDDELVEGARRIVARASWQVGAWTRSFPSSES